MNVNPKLYESFLIVAETGSTTSAAEKMCVSQPAVTKAIKELENQIGAPLFTRSSEGMELTEEGALLYEKASAAFAILRDGEESVGKLAALKTGQITIGAPSVVTKILLAPFLVEFEKKYPGIKVVLTNGLTDDLLYQLRIHAIDFVVCNDADDRREKGLSFQEIARIPYVFAGNNAGGKEPFAEIAKRPLILQQNASATRRYLNHVAKKKGIELNASIETVSQDLLLEFVQNGFDGFAFVLRPLAERRNIPYTEVSDIEMFSSVKFVKYSTSPKTSKAARVFFREFLAYIEREKMDAFS